MEKILPFIFILLISPIHANDCKISADLVVSFKNAITIHCNDTGKCITKQVNIPFKVYLQEDNIEQPIPSISYFARKDLSIESCYQDDFTFVNGEIDNKNLISLEKILVDLTDKVAEKNPRAHFSPEYGDENVWLFQTIPDNRPPVLDNLGNLILIRQAQNDYKQKGYLYSFNLEQSRVKFNYRKDVKLSYGFDGSFYVKDDPLFEKYKDSEDNHILVLGNYGDDQVYVKIDDENKNDQTYQTCLYTLDYKLPEGNYKLNEKHCITYKDYIINKDLYNITYQDFINNEN